MGEVELVVRNEQKRLVFWEEDCLRVDVLGLHGVWRDDTLYQERAKESTVCEPDELTAVVARKLNMDKLSMRIALEDSDQLEKVLRVIHEDGTVGQGLRKKLAVRTDGTSSDASSACTLSSSKEHGPLQVKIGKIRKFEFFNVVF